MMRFWGRAVWNMECGWLVVLEYGRCYSRNKGMAGTLVGLVGLLIFIGAIFDVDWILNLTASAQRDYPLGRKFTRIFYGLIGFLSFIYFITGGFESPM